MKVRPHLTLDGYKTSHKFQYPENTEWVYSNQTARSALHFDSPHFDNKVVFFGLQGFIKSFLIDAWNEGFFTRPKEVVVAEYKRRMDNYLGKDAVPVDHIADLHDLGYLPLSIRALSEGSRVNIKVPFLTIENTDPKFFWLTNYIETVLSAELWHPITVATIAYEYRKILNKYVEMTGASKEFADWQLHDFSMRGLSNLHAAGVLGCAHLAVAGYGTDTLPAIDYAEDYYGANSDTELVGGSVPATEHSVMCMGGRDTEIETFRRLITQVYPSGVVSIVSDTWDFWRVVTEYAAELKEEILARTPNALGLAKVVFRPDSGDPVDVITGSAKIVDLSKAGDLDDAKSWAEESLVDEEGEATPHGEMGACEVKGFFRYQGVVYKAVVEIEWNRYDKQYYYIDGSRLLSFEPATLTPEQKGAVECLDEIFGHTVNEKGFKTLNQGVGLIYGDSISLARQEAILKRLADKGYAADNIVFGIGSFSYQYVTRDTFGQAIKATAGQVDGVFREIEKDPATGDGIKKSAKGLLKVTKVGNDFVLKDQVGFDESLEGELKEVFLDSVLLIDQKFAEIRQRVKES